MENPDSQPDPQGSPRTDAEIQSSLSRRDFLKTAGALGIYAAMGIPSWAASSGVDPESLRICQEVGESDYPALCAGPNGSAWAVWQTYDHPKKADTLFATFFRNGQWSQPISVPKVSGDLYKPACAVDRAGKLWVVWSEQREDNWDLWSTTFDGASWTSPARITQKKGSDFAPRMAPAPDGSVVAVWQGRHESSYQIFLARSTGQGWSKPERVSAGEGNNWFPDVGIAPDGTVTVVWDSYRNGNYDIYLRQQSGGKWDKEILMAGSPNFEAYARVSVDHDGGAWITYEQREENWGKDFSSHYIKPVAKNVLPGFCRARVRRYANGKFFEPPQPPVFRVKGSQYGGDRNPTLRVADDGRIWLAVRRCEPEFVPIPKLKEKLSFPFWKNYAYYLDGDQWRGPISFNDLRTRIDSDMDCLPLPNNTLLAVWNSENRTVDRYRKPRRNKVYATVIVKPEVAAVAPQLTEINLPVPLKDESAIKESKEVWRARAYHTFAGGKKCHLFRGDFHRHTDISWDGITDSSITDMFRYAIDAAALDFVAVNDHNQWCGIDLDYVWWRTQKITDVFNSPPYFVSFHGYEWGLNYPHGHHNVIWPKRGQRAALLDVNTKEKLYAHLHATGGISISHTTGTMAGTDWKIYDPEFEPAVEIYQGCRSSYEYEGAPRTDNPQKPTDPGGYRKEGFVWEAWKKGYKIGVTSSSDHGSTHVSYANVYAPEASRESIFEAVRQRHTYGSTDNIILDFRTGKITQGEVSTINDKPKFKIHVAGTAPIQQLVIFKNFEVAHEMKSDFPEINLTWEDDSPAKGENHYYLRVLQTDGQLAWSSPIWLNFS